jgi:hypothetical protein
MVGYRAAEAGTTHDAIAALYGVTPGETERSPRYCKPGCS